MPVIFNSPPRLWIESICEEATIQAQTLRERNLCSVANKKFNQIRHGHSLLL